MNPHSFNKGDIVMCLKTHFNQFTKGNLYIVTCDYNIHTLETVDDNGDHNGWGPEHFIPYNKPIGKLIYGV